MADYGGDAVVSLAVLQDGDFDKALARVELTPDRARDLASALMQAATSVDRQPSMVTAA